MGLVHREPVMSEEPKDMNDKVPPTRYNFIYQWGPLRNGTREDRLDFMSYLDSGPRTIIENSHSVEQAKIIFAWMEDAWYFCIKQERSHESRGYCTECVG